jgi:molecular chaperone GrpE
MSTKKENETDGSNKQAINKADAQSSQSAEQTELEKVKDSFLRLSADFQNARKRMAQDISRRAAIAKEEFIREFLPVIDNLERALTGTANATQEQLRAGVKMTIQQLHQILQQHGIESEENLGEPFDPHRHEAVGTTCVTSQPDHSVVEVFQRGYRRDNEIFRPAKVVVNDLSHHQEMSVLPGAESDVKPGKKNAKNPTNC